MTTLFSPICAAIPCPATALNALGVAMSIPRSSAARTIALPIGCSLPRSAAAESCRSSDSSLIRENIGKREFPVCQGARFIKDNCG